MAKKYAPGELTQEINRLEVELARDPSSFERYGRLIDLLLLEGNSSRAKLLVEEGREVNKKRLNIS